MGVVEGSLTDADWIQKFLRSRMIAEWNDHLYQGYITEDLAGVSHTYSQSGQCTADVGDLMVLALAHILHIPLTIFTSVPNMAVLCVMPTSASMVSAQPLFCIHTGRP